jgi:hypothetical protein
VKSLRDRIRGQLADLKMPGSLEGLDLVLSRVDSGLGAAEAISAVLEAQISPRNNRRLQAAMRSSRLPAIKTLSDFDFRFQPSLKREQTAIAAARSGRRLYYVTLGDLITTPLRARLHRAYQRLELRGMAGDLRRGGHGRRSSTGSCTPGTSSASAAAPSGCASTPTSRSSSLQIRTVIRPSLRHAHARPRNEGSSRYNRPVTRSGILHPAETGHPKAVL